MEIVLSLWKHWNSVEHRMVIQPKTKRKSRDKLCYLGMYVRKFCYLPEEQDGTYGAQPRERPGGGGCELDHGLKGCLV